MVVNTGSKSGSVQFSCLVMSDSLRFHESQYARPPSQSPTPGVYSNPCPLSWWCYPTTSSSVIFSCLQSFPASGSFPSSQFFTSAPPSVLLMNRSGLISFKIDRFHLLAVQGTLKSLLQYHSSKALILRHSAFFLAQLSHLGMTGKNIALTR